MKNDAEKELVIQSYIDGESSAGSIESIRHMIDGDNHLTDQFIQLERLKEVVSKSGEVSRVCPLDDVEYLESLLEGILAESSLEHVSEATLMKVQAFADGELSGHQAAEVQKMIHQDADIRTLYASLVSQKSLFEAAGEVSTPLGESQDFYWSQIERQLEPHPESARQSQESFSLTAFLRWVSNPVAAPAFIVFIFCLFLGDQLQNAAIYQEVQVSSAFVDSQSDIAVYYVDEPDFLVPVNHE